MTKITTHVLDTARGAPAVGLPVRIERLDEKGRATEIGRGVTDHDGRVEELAADRDITAGQYRLIFDTEAYFVAGNLPSFFPTVVVVFRVAAADQRHHIPLLLSPFGFSAYRGS